jgi:hypothetical protein
MKLDMQRFGAVAMAVALTGLVTSSDGASVKYDSLPEIALSDRPTEKDTPKDVARTSKVEGLFTGLPKGINQRYNPRGLRYVGLFVNEDDAKKYSEDKLDRWNRRPEDSSGKGASTACFNIADHWELRQSDREWQTRLQQWPQVQSATRGSEAAKQSPENQKPRAFRIERLVRDDDKATLHLQEGWFDPVSLGARQTKAYDVAFKRASKGPGDVEVYAARAADGESVEFIVYQPLLEKNLMGVVGTHMSVLRANRHGSSDCGHARVSLRTAPGTGEHGSVQLDIVLPEKRSGQKKVHRKKGDDGANPHQPRKPREIRIRSLVVHLGVSQGLKDKAPITTVTFGWKGRERKTQIFE